MALWIEVATLDEIPTDRGLVIELGGRELVLVHRNDRFYCLDNVCPHKGAPLDDGPVDDTFITCPWHAWQFRLEDGTNRHDPSICIQTFPTRVEGDRVLIEVDIDA